MSDCQSFPLSELAEVRVSNVDKKSRLGEIPVQLCNYMDVYKNDYIDSTIEFMKSTANSIENEKFKLCCGDVIITKDSETPFDIGIPAVVMEDIDNLVCGYHLAIIRPDKTKVEPVYLAKQLASGGAAKYFSRMAAGSTRYGLSNGAIASIIIQVAPIEQQRQIAEILFTIDQTIEKTEALIHKYQQIKAGLMHDLFTRGLTADGKLRPTREQAPELYQETPIGLIPKEWSIDQFGERVSVIDPNPSHRYPLEAEEGIPICSTENFCGDDRFILDKSKLVSETTFQEQNTRCRFSPNDVIFARKGKIGLARRYGADKKVFSHTVVVMKPKYREVNPLWLLWVARSEWLFKTIDITMNTNLGVPTLGVEFIKRVEIPFPSPDEQGLMTQMLDTLSKKIEIENEQLDKLKNIKLGLMHDLLTGKVHVKIGKAETANV